MTRTIAVVTAGLSQPSSSRLLADRLAEATARALRLQDDDVRVSVIELRELAHDITDHLLTGFAGPRLEEAIATVTSADAVIAVSPVFSASYSGLFKSFFDVLEPGVLEGTPVLIAATGGTERHSLALDHALRPLFSYLHAVVVPTGVFAATSDWGSADSTTRLTSRIERAASQLVRLATGTAAPTPPDPYADPTPFEDLLFGRRT